ncbi:endonuclease-reverse transcriptase [Gregarina niphandrodes]|uniref:Endonuclease-reverse transcriptase n=1 Tax=Gregarina niphandrodes TaxID=110365 RepID=A0A023AWJ5_GRENI|nr:endonuclease-reverse transcriptase [Gregarina niphandrodes]EZG43084.1 endonuclease-reverse transcriptase [Gregarina niphandrodes]|eukprot:XP_011134683.1 endonuclease-reverse transcriptase [Gregarina niphandrodes]
MESGSGSEDCYGEGRTQERPDSHKRRADQAGGCNNADGGSRDRPARQEGALGAKTPADCGSYCGHSGQGEATQPLPGKGVEKAAQETWDPSHCDLVPVENISRDTDKNRRARDYAQPSEGNGPGGPGTGPSEEEGRAGTAPYTGGTDDVHKHTPARPRVRTPLDGKKIPRADHKETNRSPERGYDQDGAIPQARHDGSTSNHRSRQPLSTLTTSQSMSDPYNGPYPTLRDRNRPKTYQVMAINVDGYNNKKELQLRSTILRVRPHVAILSETCMPLHRTIYNDQYTVIGTSGPADGVAMMIRQDVQYSIRAKATRAIKIEIDGLVTIIGTYGPTEQTADRIKAQYWDHLAGLITEGKPLLIAGDLNAGHEHTEARTVKGITNYTRLQRLVHHHNLTIIKTPPTWLSKRSKDHKPSRTLDRIITSTIPDNDQASIAQLDWENAPADHAILTYKWAIGSLRHDQGRPRNVTYTRDPGEPTTKAWGELRMRLKQLFKQLQKPAPKQNAYTRLWEQYRKQMGEEGLTLIDQEENDLEPGKARNQLKQMLYERWGKTDTNHIPMKRESKVYLDQPPCIEEIIKAVKAINRKAATGLDGIPARHIGDIPIEDLQQFFEQIWTHTKIPRQLVDMKVKMIPKAKPRTTIENTRPITIPSTISKVLNQVILTHISPYIEPHLLPQQHAYRKGRGTATAVAELFTKFNKPGQTLLLLDLSKAFDTVNHTALFATLRATDIPSKEYNLIRDQYIDAEVRIQWAKRYAPAFPLTNGIRQGCLLSTTLFNLVEAEREKKCRAKMKSVPYDVIMYADDKAVILNEPEHAQRIIEVNKETAAEYGMLQNNAKTARLRLDRDTKEIQTVKWMGILLDNKMSMNQEVVHRIGKAKKAAADYAETVKNIPPSMMSTRIKVSTACTIILPHLVYLWREIPFTVQQRETLTDAATQLLAREFSNTSGVTASSILRHVHEITKGLTPRMKQIGDLGDILPTAAPIDGVSAGTAEQPELTNGTDIKYARLDQQLETLPDKGTTALRMKVPRLLLPTTEAENFFSPREEPHYEETRDVFTITLETSPPTPGFGKDKHHPQIDNMTLRLDTIQQVEQAQLACPYVGLLERQSKPCAHTILLHTKDFTDHLPTTHVFV